MAEQGEAVRKALTSGLRMIGDTKMSALKTKMELDQVLHHEQNVHMETHILDSRLLRTPMYSIQYIYIYIRICIYIYIYIHILYIHSIVWTYGPRDLHR